MHRLNTALRAPVVPERPARHGDTALQRGIADKTLRPQMGEELLTRDHPVRVGQEIGEHLENLAVERDQASRATEFVAARIQRTVLEDVAHRPLLGRSTVGAAPPSLAALDRQCLTLQPPRAWGSPRTSPAATRQVAYSITKYQLCITRSSSFFRLTRLACAA